VSFPGDQLQGENTIALTESGIFRLGSPTNAWSKLVDDVPEAIGTAIAYNQAANVVLLGTRAGLYRSVTAGDSWIRATSGPTGEISSIIVVGANGDAGDYAIAAAKADGVYRTDDWGWNWTKVGAGLPTGNVLALASSPRGVLYAGIEGGGVYRSSDAGATWSATGGLTDRTVTSLTMNSHGVLFAGTDRGVYRSVDAGVSFARVNTDHNGVVRQVYDDGRGRILAMTDAGVFVSDPIDGGVAGVMPTKATTQSLTLAVSGNPVGNHSRVHFSSRSGANVRLALVDARGNVQRVLAEGAGAIGDQSVLLETGGLASGVYFVVLSSDDESAAVPVIIE
jgi:hypothetical protein